MHECVGWQRVSDVGQDESSLTRGGVPDGDRGGDVGGRRGPEEGRPTVERVPRQ